MKIEKGYTLSQFVDLLNNKDTNFIEAVRRYNEFLKKPLEEIKPYLTESTNDMFKHFGLTIPHPLIETIGELFNYCDLLELKNLEI